ncbi:MAG: excinuclease ABC subunit UvrC [Clostridia bacterium]|nr:excinuclease ABC subunit UvrC [Clostridia bacterium]
MITERIERLKAKAASLPLEPGVYIMKNSDGEIIYIGKAKVLKNRVSQYFGAGNQHTLKVRKMVSNVEDFEYIICDSEFEAFILESSLIKQHKPKYNILLKDDKGYFYIKITNENWPRIRSVKQKENDGAHYIGPYNSGFVVNQTVSEANKIFKLPQCGRTFGNRYDKPCLNHHIGLCSAPCCKKISHSDYMECVRSAVSFIKGEHGSAISELTERMETAAENLDFELAARLRDRINAIKRIKDKQKVITARNERCDVIAMVAEGEKVCFCVLQYNAGHMEDCSQYITDADDNAANSRYEFIQRYYSARQDIPKIILCDSEPADCELLCLWLTEKRGSKVEISVPQKGERYHLVAMCRNNAAEYLSQQSNKTGHQMQALAELASLLNLSSPPEYIEAYDISNTAGFENVAGMTVFKDGKPLKSAYKRFKIKTFSGQDDYESMREVLERRFTEYRNNDTGYGFGKLPDLILLDGGKGQLGAVKEVLKKLNINVPVFGMVKDSKHRTRAIAADGGDIVIKANRRAYTLVATIQEETHRFAVGYHHKRAKNSTLKSRLTEIEGVGENRATLLLKHYKTITAISDATAEELASVKGITLPVAQKIYEFFHN